MKCIVIYFSCTGNTEKIARAIQMGVKQAAGHCDILPIKDANPKRLRRYDLIGFGNPVMGGAGFTTNVALFIKDMRFVGGKHLFAFCTSHSGDGDFPQIVPKFKERGLTVIGWRAWQGSVYGPLGEPTPSTADGHPDKIDLEEAEMFGREMVWLSQRIYAGATDLIPADPPKRNFPGGFLPTENPAPGSEGDFALKKLMHFRLNYDKSSCLYPKCTLCMDNCPMDGIDLTLDPPVIGKPCMNCSMCDQLCPAGAIGVDEEHMRWQYDIEADRQPPPGMPPGGPGGPPPGFGPPGGWKERRQYVPKEELVGYKKQVYNVYNKHPRFVIGLGRPYGFDPASLEKRGD